MKKASAGTFASDRAPQADHVIVVEAAGHSASPLIAALVGQGLTASRVGDAPAAACAALEEPADALLIDAHLNADDATAVCRAVRQGSDIPILVLVADVEVALRIDAEHCGADACVADACWAAYLRALIGRARALPDGARVSWRIDMAAGEVLIGGRALDLTPSEFRLLAALLEAKGRTCSRDELLGRLEPQQRRDVCDRTVDIHIRSLRRKICVAVGPVRARIFSVYGVGYRFEA